MTWPSSAGVQGTTDLARVAPHGEDGASVELLGQLADGLAAPCAGAEGAHCRIEVPGFVCALELLEPVTRLGEGEEVSINQTEYGRARAK